MIDGKLYQDLFSSDRPITRSAEDRLGRHPFARAMASAIRGWRGQDSLVIALYGSWGTGKSSIKNLVLEELREAEGSVPTTEFNPWQSANRNHLTEAFLNDVGTALGKRDVASKEKRGKLIRRWRRYAAYLNAGNDLFGVLRRPLAISIAGIAALMAGSTLAGAQGFSIVVGIIVIFIAAVLGWSSRFAKAIADLITVRVEAHRQTLDEIKDEVVESVRDLESPVLVVLDDIDRLTPREIQELFQLVKANADLPNIVYLVLCDRDTVAQSIEKSLAVDGREYLEKIVQVAFDVPVIECPRLQQVLFDGLNGILESPEVSRRVDQVRWGNIYFGGLQAYFQNLRQVNRFLASLAFHVSLFRGEGAFEVNPIDLIALEALRLFDPGVLGALPPNKKVLTSEGYDGIGGDEEERRRILEGIVERSPETRRREVREIVKRLFPPAEWAFGGSHYGADFNEQWFRDLRVCSADVFDRYFHFAIPHGDLSQSDLDRILAAAGDRERLVTELRSLAAQDLLVVAMDRLEAYKQEIPLVHALPFVTAIFDIGEEIPHDGGGTFLMSPSMGTPCVSCIGTSSRSRT